MKRNSLKVVLSSRSYKGCLLLISLGHWYLVVPCVRSSFEMCGFPNLLHNHIYYNNRTGGSNLTVVRPFPQKGGVGVLPQKKCCLQVHFGTIFEGYSIDNHNFRDRTFMVNKTFQNTKTVLTTTYEVICTVN